jgi:thiamine-phosphate pyrophosphorylase
MADNVAALLRVMLVTDDALVRGRDLVTLALAAERGGASCVQLRLKRADPRELAAATRALQQALAVPVLINDRADVAIATGAAGVHLGPDDVPVELVRRIAPAGFVIGASVGNPAETVFGAAADYWGVGPWRETRTKDDAGEGLGPAGFHRMVALAAGRPCVAIGGVRPEDVAAVLEAGGRGVAVVSGILGADDVEAAARRYSDAILAARGQLAPPDLPHGP